MRYLSLLVVVLVPILSVESRAEERSKADAGSEVNAGERTNAKAGSGEGADAAAADGDTIAATDGAEKGAVEAFGGRDVLAIVEGAERVVAHRIESDAETYRKTGEYKVVGEGVELSKEDAQELIATMTDPSLYEWEMSKGCLPEPGIRFQFHRGGDVVDMPVCLECAIFMVDYKGKPVGGQHCDAAVDKLLSLGLRLFPTDAGLLELRASLEYEAARVKKLEETRKRVAELRSPTDGAKLETVEEFGDFYVLRSVSDRLIWLWGVESELRKADASKMEDHFIVTMSLLRERNRIADERRMEAREQGKAEEPEYTGPTVSPVAGAKLLWLDKVERVDILQSWPDGSVWLYTKEKGLYEPPAGGDLFQDPLALVVWASRENAKQYREREERERKEAEEKQKIFGTMVAPSDGAGLRWLKDYGDVDIVQSTGDGSVWLYKKTKGLYKPDPANESLASAIAYAVKRYREEEAARKASAEAAK